MHRVMTGRMPLRRAPVSCAVAEESRPAAPPGHNLRLALQLQPLQQPLHPEGPPLHHLARSQLRALLAVRAAGSAERVAAEVACSYASGRGAGGCVLAAALGRLIALQPRQSGSQGHRRNWQSLRRGSPHGQLDGAAGVAGTAQQAQRQVQQREEEVAAAFSALLDRVLSALPHASVPLLATLASTALRLGLLPPPEQQASITAAVVGQLSGPCRHSVTGQGLALFAWATFGLWEQSLEDQVALVQGIARRGQDLRDADLDRLQEAFDRLALLSSRGSPQSQQQQQQAEGEAEGGSEASVIRVLELQAGGDGAGEAGELGGEEASLLACEGCLPETSSIAVLRARLRGRARRRRGPASAGAARADAPQAPADGPRSEQGVLLGRGGPAEEGDLMFYI